MGEENYDDLINQTLKDLDKTQVLFLKTIKSWYSRTNKWFPTIEKMFKSKEIEFVLVGTSHLVGKEGLLQKLMNNGYKVVKLK